MWYHMTLQDISANGFFISQNVYVMYTAVYTALYTHTHTQTDTHSNSYTNIIRGN